MSEAIEEREARPIPSMPSIMNHGHRAEWLTSHLIQPEIQDELSQLGASTFFREAFMAITRVSSPRDLRVRYLANSGTKKVLWMQLANSLVAMRELISQGKVVISEARREAEEAQTRAKRAKGALEAARTDRAAELKEAARWADVEADRTRAALNQLGEAEGTISDRNRKIVELSSSLQVAEGRVEHAEEEARRAASLVAEEETKAREAEAAVEGRVAGAIKEFRQSMHFSEEMAEASVDAYLQGFWDGKEKVARVLDFPRALEIEPDLLPRCSNPRGG